MLQRLRRSGRMTWLIGMAVSHVFALHIVLASLVSAQMAAASYDVTAICLSDQSTDQGTPTKPHGDLRHAICAVCTFANFSATAPNGDVAPVINGRYEPIVQIERGSHVASDDRHDPRCSRGPPDEL